MLDGKEYRYRHMTLSHINPSTIRKHMPASVTCKRVLISSMSQ